MKTKIKLVVIALRSFPALSLVYYKNTFRMRGPGHEFAIFSKLRQ